MLAGELRCCFVRLTNSGSGALANLRLAVASPDIYCGAQSPDEGSKALRADPVLVESFRDGQALYALGPASRLAPGASLRWPLWLHPRAAGELTFHYVWHYEPEELVDGMRNRCGSPRCDGKFPWPLVATAWAELPVGLMCCTMLHCTPVHDCAGVLPQEGRTGQRSIHMLIGC